MTPIHHELDADHAVRIGLTNLEIAEKRRRIAEIAFLVAQAKAGIADREAALEHPAITARDAAAKKLEIAEVAYEIAQLRNESALLKIDLAENRERFPS